MKSEIKLLFMALIIGPVLSGCMKVVTNHNVTSSKDLRDNQILLVGKIELVPPLRDKEQILSSQNMTDDLKDKALVLFDDEKYDMSDIPSRSSRAASTVRLGETFFIPVERDGNGIVFYSGGIIVINDIELTGNKLFGLYGIASAIKADHFKLPGKLKFSTKKSDRAIYIGTIRYYRDDFNSIYKVELIDQYNQANNQMLHKISDASVLTKSNMIKW